MKYSIKVVVEIDEPATEDEIDSILEEVEWDLPSEEEHTGYEVKLGDWVPA